MEYEKLFVRRTQAAIGSKGRANYDANGFFILAPPRVAEKGKDYNY